GLDVLLTAYPSIRARLGGARLRVFSGMGIYTQSYVAGQSRQDDYASLYELCAALPEADYVGPLPHADLAAAMAEADIWAYPCTFAETSCISAMEAMAAGALIITTSLGALPET